MKKIIFLIFLLCQQVLGQQNIPNGPNSFVIPDTPVSSLGDYISSPKKYLVFQRSNLTNGTRTIDLIFNKSVESESFNQPITYEYAYHKFDVNLSIINTVGWVQTTVQPITGNSYKLSINLEQGWYRIAVKVNNPINVPSSRTFTIDIGIGDVFIIAGQSNAAGYGNYANVNVPNPLVRALKPNSTEGTQGLYRKKTENFTIDELNNFSDNNNNNSSFGTNGKGKYFWHILGDKLVRNLNPNIPVLFYNMAVENSNITNWNGYGINTTTCADDPNMLLATLDIYQATAYYAQRTGFRAILWQQGEADAALNTSNYDIGLTNLINGIKGNFGENGQNIPWVISKTSRNCYTSRNCITGSYTGGSIIVNNQETQPTRIAQQNVINNSALKNFAGPDTDDISMDCRRNGNCTNNSNNTCANEDNHHFTSTNSLNLAADKWFSALNPTFFNSSGSNIVSPKSLRSVEITSDNKIKVSVLNINGYLERNHKLYKKNGSTYSLINSTPTYQNNQASFNLSGSGEYYIQYEGIRGGNTFVEQVTNLATITISGGGCTPNTPAPSANPNTINATSGTSVLSSGCGSNTTNWYNAASGGSLVGTGGSWTTPTISTTTTYYAACNNGTCESSRVSVTVSVNPPSGGSCVSSSTIPNGNYKIKLKSTGQYIRPNASNKMEQSTVDNSNIYNISTSGGWTTITNISNNQNLQSQGESPGSYIIQTSPSGDSHQKFLFQLDGTSYKIIPQNVNGWGWGLSLETYSGSGEYGLIRQYGFDGNNSLFDVCPSGGGGCTPNTPIPSANPNTINATSGTSVLSSSCGSNTTNWYNSASGGSLVGTGSPFTTLTISTTTIYYAACNNGSCESSRVGVTVNVNPPSGGSCVSSTPIPNGNYKIKLKSTGQYIRPNASNKMEQSTVDNSNIYNISTSGGWTTITNISNNQNLQSQGESPGSYIIQTSPSGDSHQKFLFQLDGTSYKIIPQNVNGWGWGLSLETYSGSGEYGLIRQYGFDGNNSLFDVCPSGSGGARLSFEKTESLVQKNESLISSEKENNVSKENTELFVIYPNPTSSIITLIVYSEKETTGEFNIYDNQGKTIKNTNKSLKSGSQEIKIDLGKQIEGRYFIKGVIDNKILTKPFVIQN